MSSNTDLEKLKVSELKDRLRAIPGATLGGNKADLVNRLQFYNSLPAASTSTNDETLETDDISDELKHLEKKREIFDELYDYNSIETLSKGDLPLNFNGQVINDYLTRDGSNKPSATLNTNLLMFWQVCWVIIKALLGWQSKLLCTRQFNV